MNLMQDLESEIQSMQKRGTNPDFIQKKSKQIDIIINAVNYASELIDLLIFDRSSASIEIFCLQKELSNHLSNDVESLQNFLSKENTFEHLQSLIETYKSQRNED